jgi:hypothetical protein
VLVQPAVKGRHTTDTAHGICSAVSNRAHGREGPHPGEQQTPKSLYSAVHALKHTADTLPCPAGTGTRQTSSTVAVTAVTTLPCACTRQMVCRVQKRHYRVYGRHGRGVDSGSAQCTFPMLATESLHNPYFKKAIRVYPRKKHGFFFLFKPTGGL